MTKADDNRARIAELRRRARAGQWREPDDPSNVVSVPASRGKSGAGEVTFVEVGRGAGFLTLGEAARRLRITVGELEDQAKLTEVGAYGGFVALSEVERLAAEGPR